MEVNDKNIPYNLKLLKSQVDRLEGIVYALVHGVRVHNNKIENIEVKQGELNGLLITHLS